VAAAMGTWKGRQEGKLDDVTYLAPYFLPTGFWLPFEMMGPFTGSVCCCSVVLQYDVAVCCCSVFLAAVDDGPLHRVSVLLQCGVAV